MSQRRFLILAIVAAALLRAAWSVTVSPAAFLEIDGADYRDIAQNLSAGRGYVVSAPRWFEPAALLSPGPHPDFARPPLLPVLGAALFRLPGAWETWARALMIALGTLAVWLVFRAGEAIFGARRTALDAGGPAFRAGGTPLHGSAGIIAAGIFALHPYAIYYSGRWSTETPFLVAMLGAIVIAAESGARDRPGLRAGPPRLALAGLLAGLAALARPTGLVLVPALAAWILLHRNSGAADAASPAPVPATRTQAPRGLDFRRPRAARRRLACAGVFLIAAGLALAPWTLRNHAATGQWNPGTFFGPYNLWAGMHDRVLMMYHSANTPRYRAEVNALFREDSRAMVREMEARGIAGPVAEGRYWTEAALGWVRAHPGGTAEILVRRSVHYFRMTPEASVMSRSAQVAALYLWPVHLLALLALWWHRRRVPWLLLAPPAAGLLASLPFVFSLRFRFPFLDPYAVLFAAAAASELRIRLRP